MFPLTDTTLIFTVLISVMLIAPLLAERLRMPDLIFLLISGMVLGPKGFGVLERSDAVTMFGNVGMLYIMFLAGLEIDIYRFAQNKWRGISFGALTFIVPQMIGTLVFYYLLKFDLFCSILLASMLASHTLLAYPLAARLGISRSEPVSVTVGATVLADIMALLVLAVIADHTRGEQLGFMFWFEIIGGLLGLIVLTLYCIPRMTRWFFISVTEAGGTQFLFVLVVVCSCAFLSHFAKMEPIIGAFLAGIAFSRLIPEQSVLRNRVIFTGNTLFIPFFLVSVGMLVDLRGMFSGGGWHIILIMITLAIVTKYLAAWLAGRIFGYSLDAINVMFGLSVVRVAATLATALVGYDLKIFNETILNGAMAMIIVTCPLGAWSVNKFGRRLTGMVQISDYILDDQQRLLVPVANPVYALRLLDLAFLIRDKALAGEIRALSIVHDGLELEHATVQAEKLLTHCLTHAAAADISVVPSLRVDLNTSDGIIHAAKESQSDLVLLGWAEGQMIRSRIFGSIMDKILDSCPARLLFCRLVSQPNTTRRINLLFPPLSANRIDIRQLIDEVLGMTSQMGIELRAYITDKDSSAIKAYFDDADKQVAVAFVVCDSLSQMRTRYFEDIKPDDMLIIARERPNSPLWNPTVDKLPELLSARFVNNSLLVAFPPLILSKSREAAVIAPTAEPVSKLPFAVYAQELPVMASLEHALKLMVDNVFASDRQLSREALSLLIGALSYPVEITSGMVLLHAHCERLFRPTVIVGHCKDQWEFPGLHISASNLLILLSPKNQPPDMHLKSLAELARKFYTPEAAAVVAKATTANEICCVIRQ